jgi:L-lactate dehydrogenase complex protein LldF
MGAVLTPQMVGIERAGDLPNASTFCGRCAEVCPVRIPLPDLMRHWREREYEGGHQAPLARWGLGIWAGVAARPALYHRLVSMAARVLWRLGRRRGRLRRLPLAGGWTRGRDLPSPARRTFVEQWRAGAR